MRFGTEYEDAVRARIKQLYEQGQLTSEQTVKALENIKKIACEMAVEGVEAENIVPRSEGPTMDQHVRKILDNAEIIADQYVRQIGERMEPGPGGTQPLGVRTQGPAGTERGWVPKPGD